MEGDTLKITLEPRLERRFARLDITAELLTMILKGLQDGPMPRAFRMRNGLPIDARLAWIEANEEARTFSLVVASESFAPVHEHQAIPVLDPVEVEVLDSAALTEWQVQQAIAMADAPLPPGCLDAPRAAPHGCIPAPR